MKLLSEREREQAVGLLVLVGALLLLTLQGCCREERNYLLVTDKKLIMCVNGSDWEILSFSIVGCAS